MKKTITMLLVFIMLISMVLAGCQVAPAPEADAQTETQGDATDDTAHADHDDNAIVATVGDTDITLGEYERLFDQYAYYYSMFGMDVYSDESMLAEFRSMVLDAVLEKAIIRYQAIQQNVQELSAEQLKTVEEDVESTMEDMRSQFTTMAEEAKASDDTVDVDQYIDDMIADEAEYNTGTTMTADEYQEWLKNEASLTHMRDNLMDVVCSDVTVTQEAIDAWYEETLAADKEAYESDPVAYKSDEEYYECSAAADGVLPPTYVPEGYSRVMDMLVKPRTDVSEAYPDYNEKVEKMNNLQMQYNELAFEDAVDGTGANKAHLNEIITEYKALKTEIDAMEEDAGAESKGIIEEAYAKLQEGTSFESLLIRYTENDTATDCERLMMDGLLINPDLADDSWSSACIEEFKKLSIGQYSPVFLDESGYHILYYVGDETAGDRPLTDIQDAVKASLLEEERTNTWQTILAEWMQDDSVTVYEDVYSSVGA